MLDYLFKIKKFIPTIIVKTIYDVDFTTLYANGKRFILFDLDNTLISYDVDFADEKLKSLITELKNMGYTLMVVSNNHNKRVSDFCNDVDIECITMAAKPLKKGFKKALKLLNIKNKKEVITIGDQMMTDILGSNRCGIDSILVHPIKKGTEKWYTKNNRKMEKSVFKRIKKYDINIYKQIEENHEY